MYESGSFSHGEVGFVPLRKIRQDAQVEPNTESVTRHNEYARRDLANCGDQTVSNDV